MSTNSVLTPCKQGAVLSRYSHAPKVKKCGFKNKYLLTVNHATSAENLPTLLRKYPQTPRKKFLRNVEISISEVKNAFFSPKKRRNPACLGLSPLRWYKDNTFSAEIQIALTLRNTPLIVTLQRFAADGVWRILYYEAEL